MGLNICIFLAGILAGSIVLRADLLRRRLSFFRSSQWRLLTTLDVVAAAVTMATAAGLLVAIVPIIWSQNAIPLNTPGPWEVMSAALVFCFLWIEGRRQIQFQRPQGIVFGEWLILAGAWQVIAALVFRQISGALPRPIAITFYACAMLAGAVVIAYVVPPFLKHGEERHILERLAEQGDFVQDEYTPPTPECPHPELWKMMDSQTSEVEVLDFLKSPVTTIKPRLIVETGTFLGYGTIKMAEGLKENGFGRLITIEYDPDIYAKAKQRIEASGLADWIEARNQSSLDTQIDGTIDFLYSDSLLKIREQEIRKFLPQLDGRSLIAIHDASSHFAVVREGALRLEQEGLISVILLPTPRGLVLAQKREGRK